MKPHLFRAAYVAKVTARDGVDQSVVNDEVTERAALAEAGETDEQRRPFGLLCIETCPAAVDPRAEPLHVLSCTYNSDTDALRRRRETAVQRPMFCEAVPDVDVASR